MSQQNLNKVFSQVLIVEDITSDTTLDTYDTGKTFRLFNAAGLIVTLPPAADVETGWNCKFVVGAIGGDYVIQGDSSTAPILGLVQTTDGNAGVSSVDDSSYSAQLTINGSGGAVVTDNYELLYTGDHYQVTGLMSGSGGSTFS